MEPHEDTAHYPPVDPFSAGLRGCCPRCGEGRLFDGFLTLRPACTSCGLDYAFADAGDGPVVFVLLIVGFVFIGGALWMQVAYDPPLWLLFAVWIPPALAASLVLMRLLKGVLITLQYANKAKPGQISRD